jgi:hypothetical protein
MRLYPGHHRQKLWLIWLVLLIACAGYWDDQSQSNESHTPVILTSVVEQPTAEIPQTFTPVLEPEATPGRLVQTTPEIALSPIVIPAQELRHVMSADVRMIWWSSDSNRLFASGGGFAYYDVQEGTLKPFAEDPGRLNETPQPEILAQLPPYHRVYVSPSGNRAIYISLADALPTQTPDPNIEGGESPPLCGPMEMWLWENDRAYSLSRINHCHFYQHIWSPDEQKVVFVEFGIPMLSGPEGQAWLIDLERNASYPLFQRDTYPPLQVYGFTPDGNQLLHGFFSDLTGANLFLLDIDSLQSIPLAAPVHGLPENTFIYPTPQWVDGEKILVIYRGNEVLPPYPVGILDVKSLGFTALTTMFSDEFITYAVLSPDRKWLAFTTGERWFPQEDLWLLRVNLGN